MNRRSRRKRWARDRRYAHAADDRAVDAGPACGVTPLGLSTLALCPAISASASACALSSCSSASCSSSCSSKAPRSADCPKRACLSLASRNFSFSISRHDGALRPRQRCERLARRAASLSVERYRQAENQPHSFAKQCSTDRCSCDLPIAGLSHHAALSRQLAAAMYAAARASRCLRADSQAALA